MYRRLSPCPPTGLAKLYAAIPGNREIRRVQGSQHGYVPPEYAGRDIVWKTDSGVSPVKGTN